MSASQSQMIPPQNLEAEMAVLGSVLVDQCMLDEILDFLLPEDFYARHHGDLFAAMLALKKDNQPIDLISMVERLHRLPSDNRQIEYAFLTKLMDTTPTAASIVYYATLVREKASLRGILKASNAMSAIAYRGEEDVEKAFAEADAAWRRACERKSRTRGALNFPNALKANYERITDIAFGVTATLVQQTPWRGLNLQIGGFFPGNLVVWAGAAKSGKSGAVLFLSDFVSEQYGPVMYCSIELTLEEMVMRYVALYSAVSVKRQLEGNLSEYDLSAISDAQEKIRARKVFFFGREECGSVAGIRTEIRSLVREHAISAIVVDGINFLKEVDSQGARDHSTTNERLNAVYKEFLRIAGEYKVVFHAVTHINRAGTQKNGPPSAEDIRDGGNPEGHAHAIIMPYRPLAGSDSLVEREQGDFVVAATRVGERGSVPMSFKGATGCWLDRDDLRPWFETSFANAPVEEPADMWYSR
jgi:replicative DNA helicase